MKIKMVKDDYSNVYKEVLTVLSNLIEKDYNKIPKEYIKFLEENCSKDYEFNYDISKNIDQQNLSNNAKYILFGLFEKFGATEKQKEKIKLFKNNYYKKIEEQQREKYNPNNLFENRKQEVTDKTQSIANEVAMVEYKESIFKRFINKIKNIFHLQ